MLHVSTVTWSLGGQYTSAHASSPLPAVLQKPERWRQPLRIAPPQDAGAAAPPGQGGGGADGGGDGSFGAMLAALLAGRADAADAKDMSESRWQQARAGGFVTACKAGHCWEARGR